MAITSSKVPTSHTCHNTDEPIIKGRWRGDKNEGVLPRWPFSFHSLPSFSAQLLRHKGVSPQTAPSFIPAHTLISDINPCLVLSLVATEHQGFLFRWTGCFQILFCEFPATVSQDEHTHFCSNHGKKTELRLDMYKSCNRLSDLKQCSETYCTRHCKGTWIYILPYVAIFGIWRPPVRVDVKVGSGLT